MARALLTYIAWGAACRPAQRRTGRLRTVAMSTQTETALSNGTSQKSTYVPTHPDAIRVEFQDGDYNSYAVASRVGAHSLRQPFQKGEIIATFEHATPSPVVRYSTVQTGDDAHLELNSECVSQLTPACSTATTRVTPRSSSTSTRPISARGMHAPRATFARARH